MQERYTINPISFQENDAEIEGSTTERTKLTLLLEVVIPLEAAPQPIERLASFPNPEPNAVNCSPQGPHLPPAPSIDWESVQLDEACEILTLAVSSVFGQLNASMPPKEEKKGGGRGRRRNPVVVGQNILRTWEGETGNS